MRLEEIFTDPPSLGPLYDRAQPFDDPSAFGAAVERWPRAPASERLARAIAASAADLERAAETGVVPAVPPIAGAQRPVLGGQQAYVDYTPGVLAKLDALETAAAANVSGRGFFAFADYDNFGSDRLISRTDLPRVDPLGDRYPLLRFRVHPGLGRHRHKDMRWVPPPSREHLERALEPLLGMVGYTGRRLPGFPRRAAREGWAGLAADYEHARRASRHVGEFNCLWSLRRFRQLGFGVPCVALSGLLEHPDLRLPLAEILADVVRRQRLFVESAAEAIAAAGDFDTLMKPPAPDALPLRMTDPASGRRFALRLERRGRDVVFAGAGGFRVSVGRAGRDELAEFFERHAGRWSFDVFLPIFLFRLGVAGLVNGRGSIRYSLVIGHVLSRLYGAGHPPNLLAAGRLGPEGPFTAMIRARRGDLPPEVESLEATLVAMSLAGQSAAAIRAAVAAAWRHGGEGA